MKNLVGAVAVSTSVASMAFADNHALKIGFMATLEGPYTVLGEDSQRGFQMELNEFGNEVAGRPIEVTIGATDASPESALRAARHAIRVSDSHGQKAMMATEIIRNRNQGRVDMYSVVMERSKR